MRLTGVHVLYADVGAVIRRNIMGYFMAINLDELEYFRFYIIIFSAICHGMGS